MKNSIWFINAIRVGNTHLTWPFITGYEGGFHAILIWLTENFFHNYSWYSVSLSSAWWRDLKVMCRGSRQNTFESEEQREMIYFYLVFSKMY